MPRPRSPTLTLRIRACRAALLAMLLLAPGARAQTGAPAPAPAAATPNQARQLLETVNDPKKRAALTQTLQTLAKTAPAAAPPAPAKTPVAAIPLAPDSLGAELLLEGAGWIGGLSHQLASLGRLFTNFPAIWRWLVGLADNAEKRAVLFDIAWRLALVLIAAGVAEALVERLLARPMARVTACAPSAGSEPEDDATPATDPLADPLADPDAADAHDRAAASAAAREMPADGTPIELHRERHLRLSRTWRGLSRLPFVLLRFLLDLIPVGVFAAIGTIGTEAADRPLSRLILLAVINAYLVVRVATCLTRMFVSPDAARLRLIHMSDEGAAYTLVWVRRLIVVAAFGFALCAVCLLLGLPTAAHDTLLKLIALIDHVFLVVIVLQVRVPVAKRIHARAGRTGMLALLQNRLAMVWHYIAIFYIMALWVVWAAEVRNGYGKIWRLFVVTCAVLIVARLIGIVALGSLDRLFRISPEMAERYPGLEARANRYYAFLRGMVSSLLVVITGLALLQGWGLDVVRWLSRSRLGGHILSASLTIGVAALLSVALWEGANASLDRRLAQLTREAQLVRSARIRTLLPILRTALFITLLIIFGLTALSEIGVNIAPLLAGAGILGVAIGFGSQKLVQDFITGIFLLLENAMQVGDNVTLAGLSGTVETLSIRTIRLRAGDGSVHIIPFSSVSTVTNVNRGRGNAAVSVTIAADEDTDRAADTLVDIAHELRADPTFGPMTVEDFALWGVDRVDGQGVTILGQIVCTDAGRWGVQREFNRRMNRRFQELGIRLAVPVQLSLPPPAAPTPQEKLRLVRNDAAPAAEETLVASPPPSALGNTQ